MSSTIPAPTRRLTTSTSMDWLITGPLVFSERRSMNGRMPEHVSQGVTQTTGRYLRCKQKLRCAVNDRIGIEPDDAR